MVPTDAGLLTTLRQLEVCLLENSTRHNQKLVASMLTEDFREFGSSGRIYTRADVLDLLSYESPQTIAGEDFEVRILSADAALLTYKSIKASAETALRSSLWVRCDGEWKMLFHQGTRIA